MGNYLAKASRSSWPGIVSPVSSCVDSFCLLYDTGGGIFLILLGMMQKPRPFALEEDLQLQRNRVDSETRGKELSLLSRADRTPALELLLSHLVCLLHT